MPEITLTGDTLRHITLFENLTVTRVKDCVDTEDKLEGVAENIIVGQPVTLGTGAVKLVWMPQKASKE